MSPSFAMCRVLSFATSFMLAASRSVFAAEQGSATSATPTAWQAYEFFHRHCVDCHGGHLAKPKGKLGYILDLRRLVDEGKIIPADPDNSDLFAALVSTDDEEKMPPPDSEGPKPTPADIDLVRAWIAAGAATADEPVAAPPTPPEPAETPPTARPLGQKLGRLHALLVHFPIALLLGAGAAELLSRLRPRNTRAWQGMTRGSLWLAAIGGIFAAACGWLNAAYEGFASDEVDVHRWLGVTTAALAVITLIASELAERARARNPERGSRGFLVVMLVVSAVVVTLAGHTGGVMVYGQDYFGF